MLTQIKAAVLREIRKLGNLSYQQAGEAVGRSHDTIRRWEKDDDPLMPKREQEEMLVAKVKLTRLAFGEIICKVLTEFVGRLFIMVAPDTWIASLPLQRAQEAYSRLREQLRPETRAAIEEMLAQGRMLDVAAEQTSRIFEQQIRRLIELDQAARAATAPSSGGQ